jgi:uncharacterized RDD family membrane protein YckC
MTADVYVQSVMDRVPQGMPLRDQIAMELRSHISERVEHGQALDEVLRQLGDPLTLAESYLSSVPLQSADALPRLFAKIIDAGVVAGAAAILGCAAWLVLPEHLGPFALVLTLGGGAFGFVVYTIYAEYSEGQTVGKRVMHLRVVTEAGARISLGQSMLRQLPFFAQFFVIDALFALFTERHQRAFELLTKTRTVVAPSGK